MCVYCNFQERKKQEEKQKEEVLRQKEREEEAKLLEMAKVSHSSLCSLSKKQRKKEKTCISCDFLKLNGHSATKRVMVSSYAIYLGDQQWKTVVNKSE
jgi:hypothetical protein